MLLKNIKISFSVQDKPTSTLECASYPKVCVPKSNAMQAHDERFVNASVKFDLATLRPTYTLAWGCAGDSHALAVAEGLGFDPAILASARSIAAASAAGAAASIESVQVTSLQLDISKLVLIDRKYLLSTKAAGRSSLVNERRGPKPVFQALPLGAPLHPASYACACQGWQICLHCGLL